MISIFDIILICGEAERSVGVYSAEVRLDPVYWMWTRTAICFKYRK